MALEALSAQATTAVRFGLCPQTEALSAQATTAVRFGLCPQTEAACQAPDVPREFRGVWVATVANMDWPSRPGLQPDSARLELTALLDHAVRTGLNAVVFQVRPAGDALYASRLEPWSEYLTGRQGTAPAPMWDPLAFAVREAHARGLELHAWFNPYRAKDPSGKGALAASHFARRNPQYAKRYGRYTWFDPGEPAVRKRTVDVILDVVRRYDVDGIHLDDYFYPYPEVRRRREIEFPDAASYRRYLNRGGKLERSDWRRENVDVLVDTLRREIARAKPWVKFGISPFGIWRPGEPESARGFDAFGKIYADARKWLKLAWVDYLVPQLYWGVEQDGQRFGELFRWWSAQNDSSRHVWPGLAAYKIGEGRAPWAADEILRQIDSTRAIAREFATPSESSSVSAAGDASVAPVPSDRSAPGTIHFQMKALRQDRDQVSSRLASGPYRSVALTPSMPWKGGAAPPTPPIAVTASAAGDVLTIGSRTDATVRWWVIQGFVRGAWRTRVMDAAVDRIPLSALWPDQARSELIALRAVSRTGVEGLPVAIRVR